MTRLLVAVLLALLRVNEASLSEEESALATRSGMQMKSQLEMMTQAMTVEHAMDVLRGTNMSKTVISEIQQNIMTKKRVNLKGAQKQSAQIQTESAPDANADYSSGVKNAMIRLNEMMLETINTMDAGKLECDSFNRTQSHYLEELDDDQKYYSQQVTFANAAVKDADAHKYEYGEKIPIVDAELKAHNLQCQEELADLHRQLRIAKSDREVMDKILNMTQCNDVAYEKADAAKATLLQCRNTRTGKRYQKLQVTDTEIQGMLAKLKHQKSIAAANAAMVADKHGVAFLQKNTHMMHTGHSKLSHRSAASETKSLVSLDSSVARKGDNRRRAPPPRRRRRAPTPAPKINCHCETPNEGTINKNKYLCDDGFEGHCAADQMCYSTNFVKGEWSTGCEKQKCGTKFGINFCDDWCNVESYWPNCGQNLLSATDPRNTGNSDFVCNCQDCNKCGQPKEEYGQEVLPSQPDPNLEGGAEECSMSNSSKCPELRERFVNIAGGIEDAIEELETMIANKQTKCEQIRTDLQAEMDHYGYWFKVWETRLSTSVATLGEMRTQFNQKYKELTNARSLYDEKMAQCIKSDADSRTELCALGKIRGELALMSALKDVEYQDCEVDDRWKEPACPVTCGGGVQVLTREVRIHPGTGTDGSDKDGLESPKASWDRGHECPALEAKQSCNEHRCPTDCGLADWEEWSRCTVTCGGGIRERLREIVMHPTPDGNPCELTLESVLCNAAPCDSDCVLSEWADWSLTCTKMCGSGQVTRVKTLVEAARGGGTCPTFYDASRFQARPCNVQPCEYHDAVGHCLAKADVVFVIDGSGSLGPSGWDTIKATSLKLAKAMGVGAAVGAILYSGPPNSCILRRCTGRELPYYCNWPWQPYASTEYTPEQCGVTWVSHLSTDLPDVVSKMEAMRWPAQMTLTSKALKSAQIEMINSRKGVASTVIVLTDGYPYSSEHTKANALELKGSGARLMMVPIGQAVADTSVFAEMASYPVEDNLIFAENMDVLVSSNNTVNEVLTSFCTDFIP